MMPTRPETLFLSFHYLTFCCSWRNRDEVNEPRDSDVGSDEISIGGTVILLLAQVRDTHGDSRKVIASREHLELQKSIFGKNSSH